MIFYGNEDVVYMEIWLLIICGLQNRYPVSGCGERSVQMNRVLLGGSVQGGA